MKKSILFLAFTLATFVTFSQEKKEFKGFKKKDVYLSGNVSFLTVSSGGQDQSEFNFQPVVGLFIEDAYALEFGLIIGGSEANGTETNSFGAQASLIHFFNTKNKFSFTLGGGVGYISTKVENGFQGDFKNNSIQASVFPGINYFISDNFALRANVAAVSYTSNKADFQGAEAVNAFSLNMNLSDVSFGFLYKF